MSHKSHPNGSESLADPLILPLVHASFRLANNEYRRRIGQGLPEGGSDTRSRGRGEGGSNGGSRGRGKAARLAAALEDHITGLNLADLNQLRTKLARNFLLEFDRKLAVPGNVPGERPITCLIPAEIDGVDSQRPRRVGLVSLPWMSPSLPSIQLATLAAALERDGIESDVHELYVDYAARIGLNLYNYLGDMLGYVPEWVFSRHYYGPEHGDDLSAMLAEHPLKETPWPEYSDVILEALEPVTQDFLDDIIEKVDWSQYDIVGCSLTISQLGSSMAFARRVKLRHPELKIVFGGSQCAGLMGRAILRICPYVDVVVHVEGELVLSELVRRLRGGETLEGLAGVSWRQPGGEIVSGEAGGLYRPDSERLPLYYDAYFRRLTRLGLIDKLNPWLPFEGSRGCWYGQKIQCTFCGLHEIMEFRAWKADAVLAELERLNSRYGIGRFYAMDLILPREYLRTLLPEIARREHDWMFFWEIKSNMKRKELEVLAAAGVRWIQPGIESLDADLLRLMKKGVSPLQNILLLKWCEELSIFSGWNLLFGLPGENRRSYEHLNELIPKLFHLRPPSGGGEFQLHRFSPYFDHPQDFGIQWLGAHRMFKFAFPVSKQDLDELVYLHEFEIAEGRVDTSETLTAVSEWRQAYRRGASLRIDVRADGSSRVEDTRHGNSDPRVYDLSVAETELYLFLDGGLNQTSVEHSFRQAHPDAAAALNDQGGLNSIVQRWIQTDLVLAIDGQVVALALYAARAKTNPTNVSQQTIDTIIHSEMFPSFETVLQNHQ